MGEYISCWYGGRADCGSWAVFPVSCVLVLGIHDNFDNRIRRYCTRSDFGPRPVSGQGEKQSGEKRFRNRPFYQISVAVSLTAGTDNERLFAIFAQLLGGGMVTFTVLFPPSSLSLPLFFSFLNLVCSYRPIEMHRHFRLWSHPPLYACI